MSRIHDSSQIGVHRQIFLPVRQTRSLRYLSWDLRVAIERGRSPPLLLACCPATPPLYAADDERCKALVLLALHAQGGEQKLRALRSVQWEASGYRNELEQSERPEGPYITEFDSVAEVHDLAGHRYRSTTDGVVYPAFKSSSEIVVDGEVSMLVSGETKVAGTPQQLASVREREALSPERLLLTALDAPDKHVEPDTTMQSVLQNVIAFSLDGAPVRIYLNAYTHLPTAVDYSGPAARSDYWALLLGDVTQRTYYGLWWLAKGGIHLPMQWNVESNGLPDRMAGCEKASD